MIIMASHHALLYIDTDLDGQEVPEGAELYTIEVEQFGITDARKLKDLAHQTSAATGRCFQISARTLTREAQNALLRLCEDPPGGVTFRLSVPTEGVLIATLRSRFELAQVGVKLEYDPGVAKTFLALTLAEQLAMIAEKTKAKDNDWQQQLRRGLEVKLPKEKVAARAALVLAVTHANVRGASQKMLLEHLALALTENQ